MTATSLKTTCSLQSTCNLKPATGLLTGRFSTGRFLTSRLQRASRLGHGVRQRLRRLGEDLRMIRQLMGHEMTGLAAMALLFVFAVLA